jgi:hypothetical protein
MPEASPETAREDARLVLVVELPTPVTVLVGRRLVRFPLFNIEFETLVELLDIFSLSF